MTGFSSQINQSIKHSVQVSIWIKIFINTSRKVLKHKVKQWYVVYVLTIMWLPQNWTTNKMNRNWQWHIPQRRSLFTVSWLIWNQNYKFMFKLPWNNDCGKATSQPQKWMQENMIDHRSYTKNLSCEIKVGKNSGLNGARTHDLCNTGTVLYQLRYHAISELVMYV